MDQTKLRHLVSGPPRRAPDNDGDDGRADTGHCGSDECAYHYVDLGVGQRQPEVSLRSLILTSKIFVNFKTKTFIISGPTAAFLNGSSTSPIARRPGTWAFS